MTDARPVVSVVLSNYNYAPFLPDALDSVFAQSCAADEVIVVDDGSTDDSVAVLARYPVQVIRQPNTGQAGALDAGVAAARGDIICLLDADDVWLPGKIERVVRAFAEQPDAAWLRHQLEIADAALQPTGAVLPVITHSARMTPSAPHVAERVITASTSAIALRTAARSAFPLRAGNDLRFDADALLVARLGSRLVGCQLAEVLGYYRRHERQQFAAPADLQRMLERQVAVGSLIARALGRSEPVSNFKHRAILAALQGRPRAPAVLSGLAASARLLGTPRLMLRQAAALLYAGLAPDAWLRRMHRMHGSL